MRYLLWTMALVAGTVAGLWASNGAVWHAFAGNPDLGRADYLATERPPNQFIACTNGDTGCANSDLGIELFTAAPADLLAKLDAVALNKSRVVRVDDGSDPLHRRYVARSALLRFPDTVSVDAVPEGSGTALRISSRSQIGQSDLGVNGARVREWLAAL